MSRSSSVRSTNSSCLSTAFILDGRFAGSPVLPARCWLVCPAGVSARLRGAQYRAAAAYAGAVPLLRIALAQVNPTVGDLDGNAGLVVEWTRRAASAGAGLVVFPEMMITGYPVEDLALRGSFVDASVATVRATAQRLAAEGLGGIPVITGYLDRRAERGD